MGGDGFDRIIMNDRAATGPIDYLTTQKWITLVGRDDGLRPGIRVDNSIESIRIDASNFANRFNIKPLSATRFILNGHQSTDGTDSIKIRYNP